MPSPAPQNPASSPPNPPPIKPTAPSVPQKQPQYTTAAEDNDWGYAPAIKTQHSYLEIPKPSQNTLPARKAGLERFHRRWYGCKPGGGDVDLVELGDVQSWDRGVGRRDGGVGDGPAMGVWRGCGGCDRDNAEYECLVAIRLR